MRVVLIVIDSLPHRWVRPDITPNLWQQVQQGARAPEGGIAELTAATYPNHASFVTGLASTQHRVLTNAALTDAGTFTPAELTGPGGETIFDGCTARGRHSAAIVGDQKLIGVTGATAAAHHWPPQGTLPLGTPTCALGYATNRAVVDAVRAADLAQSHYVLIQLNEPDTASHLYGPDSPEAIESYRQTDVAYGEVLAGLADGWDDTICFTVSDHEQETLTDQPPIDLKAAIADLGLAHRVWMEGTAAVLLGDLIEADIGPIRAIPGVEGLSPLPGHPGGDGPDRSPTVEKWIAWPDPGRWFSRHAYPLKGGHGSPRTRTQVSVISGGHDGLGVFARNIERQRPPAPVYGRWAMHLVEV